MVAVPAALGKPFARLAALLALAVLAACEPVAFGNNAGGSVSRGGAVPVALLAPHGAPSAQEAQLARDLEAAARLAVSDLDGVEIDLRVYGTAGKPAQARQAARNAVADGARIIVGPLHAASANAVATATAERNINVLAFSNNPTIAGGNLFILGQTFRTIADRLTRYAVRNGKRQILVVHSDNLAGRLGRDAIAAAVRAEGASLSGSVPYEFSQDGVVNAVPEIRRTAETSAADTIFLTANSAGALPLFSQMLPEAGLGPDRFQYIGLARWDTPPQTRDLPGVQGGWFALPDPARAERFASRFKAAQGTVPHPIAGLAYDGIAAVGALAKEGRGLTRGDLTQPAGFQGVGGVFRLLPDGTNQRGLAVATITDGRVEVLSPAPQGFGRAGS